MRCNNCGWVWSDDTVKCRNCGQVFRTTDNMQLIGKIPNNQECYNEVNNKYIGDIQYGQSNQYIKKEETSGIVGKIVGLIVFAVLILFAIRIFIHKEAQEGYVLDTIEGNDLSVRVLTANVESDNGNTYVSILCEVTNISSKELDFNADDYFQLDNKGIVKQGYCEYDYTKLAKGCSLEMVISFSYPKNANKELWEMTLKADGATVYLKNDPDKLEEFEGIYFYEDEYSAFTILKDGNKYEKVRCTLKDGKIDTTIDYNSNTRTFPGSLDGRVYSWSSFNYEITYTSKYVDGEYKFFKVPND